MKIIEVTITSDFIKLDSFLKLSGAVSTGGEAKVLVQQGAVYVNGEACMQRGKKLHGGDTVKIEGDEQRYVVVQEEPK